MSVQTDAMLLAAATLLSQMGDMPADARARAKVAVDQAQDLVDEMTRRAAEAVRERTLEVVCRTLYGELERFEADEAIRVEFSRMMGLEVLKALESAGLLRREAP